MFFEINSRKNENLKFAMKILKSAKIRKNSKRFLIENLKVCCDSLSYGINICSCFCTKKFLHRHKDDVQVQKMLNLSERNFLVDERLFSLISDVETPQGIVCLCKKIEEKNLEVFVNNNEFSSAIVLDKVQNPDNIGAILRSCAAFSVDLVILTSGCCDVYNPKVLRSSSSGVFRVNFFENMDLKYVFGVLRKNGFKIFAFDASNNAIPINNIKKDKKMAILFGNEGQGLSEECMKNCDEKILIPMKGKIESLNVSVAAGIAMYNLFNLPINASVS